LGTIHDEEEYNDVWTKKTISALTGYFADHNVEDTQTTQVDCRERICKVVCIHDSEESFLRFRDVVLPSGVLRHKEMHGTRRALDGGQIETVMFFTEIGGPASFREMIGRDE